ncbi:MAG: ParA family protein [Bacilli bacterium]|jgi:chromosome partitioning protein|nr:ParA family protein [Fibrobacter sp.]
MTKIIAVCNQKGGVGKTTTAVNLAASFAALEKNTLLIDMDPQGNASQGVGFNEVQDEDIHEALHLAENPENLSYEILKNTIKSTNLDFLKIITSGPDLAALEIELVNVMSRERRLERVINAIKSNFEFIIIDSPPSLNLLTLNALTAATSVLIPVQCEYYALQGLAELFNTIRLVQKNLNSELKIEGTLLTMYDARLSLSKQVAEEVRNCISEKVFQSIIPRNVKLSEAPSHGKPVILYDVQSSGAQAYVKLAEEILHGEK